MKADKKKVLAEKSIKYMLVIGIVLTIFLTFTVLFFTKFIGDRDVTLLAFGIIFSGLDTICLAIIIKCALRPKNMIEYDNYGIYLNYIKITVYLRYKDISHARAENTRGKGIEYKFGDLCIWANDEIYKIGAIKDAKEAADFINKKIAWKYSTKKSYRKKY